jgi:hypothetical protein
MRPANIRKSITVAAHRLKKIDAPYLGIKEGEYGSQFFGISEGEYSDGFWFMVTHLFK